MKKDHNGKTATERLESLAQFRNGWLILLFIVGIVMLMKVSDIATTMEQIRCTPKQEQNGEYRIPYKCQLPEGYQPLNNKEFK